VKFRIAEVGWAGLGERSRPAADCRIKGRRGGGEAYMYNKDGDGGGGGVIAIIRVQFSY